MERIIKYMLPLMLGFLLVFASCNEAWDVHYSGSDGDKSALNLNDYIQAQPEMSVFAQMLKIAGYDKVLSQPQTYTVWVPINDVLQEVNLADTLSVTEIVKNHISRFAYPTSNLQSKTIYMLGKKFVNFSRTDTGYALGGKPLLSDKSNVATENGIVHAINGFVPYLSNIWEFIGKAEGLDSLRNYLYAQSSYVFDPAASVEIGTNSNGQSVYDSVIIFSNAVLDKIGALYLEDSVYSTILPNNEAWIKAYDKIKNNYKTLPKDGGATRQRLNTQWALVQNLVFRGSIHEPAASDSLISTTGSKFKSPSYLFEGAQKFNLSNGVAYITDSIRFKASESYQQPIRIEAENSDFGRSYRYANLFVRSSLGSAFSNDVSETKYLIAEPTTVSNATQNEVTFPIPNTLSGKYRIYCVFVPSSIVNENDARRYRMSFYLSYLNSAGVAVNDAAVNASNTVTQPGLLGAVFTSTASSISKMFVTQMEFPYSNIIKDKTEASNITVKLRVKNEARITETVMYDRILRIDYIILEPVQ